MALSPKLLESMKKFKVTPSDPEAGRDFYKHFFTAAPQVRKYFKGAENFTADDVAKSDRFLKLGKGLIESLDKIAQLADKPAELKEYAHTQAKFHHRLGLDLKLWDAFPDLWLGFLAQRGSVDADTKSAWTTVWPKFSAELVAFDKTLN